MFVFAQRECDIDARNDLGQTALHMALLNGRSKLVERLIGYGASIHTVDADGNGTLHMILTRETMEAPTIDTPQLKKVTAILYCSCMHLKITPVILCEHWCFHLRLLSSFPTAA